jgi:soluble lytic murein transglycosylase-like protein
MFKKHIISIIALTALISIAPEAKETESIYKYQSKTGVPSFSDIEPIGRPFEIVKVGCYACNVKSHVDWHNAKLYLTLFKDDINSAAKQHRIDPAFVRAVIHAESHFNPKAISKQGAQGLMQLMPATAQWLGVKDPFVAQQNIKGGVKHLARLLKKYNGNARMASAAYNAGEGAVKRFGGIPPYAETKVYVERVEILRRRYQKAIRI